MKLHLKANKMPLRLLLLCLLISLSAPGESILVYTETSLAGGTWQYDYVAQNGFDPFTQSGFDLYDVLFDFPVFPTVLAIPTGWDFIVSGTSVETFSTLVGPMPLGSDVPPGASLSGFSFLFDSPVGSTPFTFTFIDPSNPAQPLTISGLTTSAVPEPGTLPLVLTIGIFVVAAGRRRRKTAA